MLVHPDFMEDYLKWGRATYAYILERREADIEPLNHSTRMTIPLKLTDGKYYWVLQEAIALQIDANGNLVTHLNIYTVLNEMIGKDDVVLIGRLYNDGFEMKEWTQTVWKDFFTTRPFELTTEHQKIVNLLNENIELSNTAIAEILNKQKNTIDVQNKQIMMRARESFPSHTFGNIKDVVRFLREINYFDDGNTKVE
jgi:hypothetical protein